MKPDENYFTVFEKVENNQRVFYLQAKLAWTEEGGYGAPKKKLFLKDVEEAYYYARAMCNANTAKSK